MKSSIFFTLCIGIISGMITGIFVEPYQINSLWWIISLGIILWMIVLSKIVAMKKPIIIFCIGVIACMIGFWRVDQFHQTYQFSSFDQYHNTTINVIGDIKKPPTIKPGKQQVRIRPVTINGSAMPEKTRDIVIHTSDLETFRIGDRINVSGNFTIRENFKSDTDRIVQYRLMSYSKKISGDIRYPKIDTVVHYKKQYFANMFFSIKQTFIKTLHQLFVAPGAGLLSGIIIGDTSAMQNDLLEIFRLVGLIHIVVLSGYNITLVANSFVQLFAPFGYFRRLIIAMIALCFFIAIVGISPTSLRAGIMALCAFSARYFVRPYMITRGIMIALVIMTWVSPYAILFDLSLQLSFLATIGIVYLFPLLQNRFPRISENMFGEILLQTVGVNLVVLPLIIYYMGYFSAVSFPVNIIVLGVIPWVTIFGFIAIFVGMISLPIGQIVVFPIQIIMDSIIKFSIWVAQHDPLRITVQPFSLWILLGVYIILFLIYQRFQSRIDE